MPITAILIPAADRVQNVEIIAVQQYGSIKILNFGTKQVLILGVSESVPFWFQNGCTCDKNSGYEQAIPGCILSLLDTFPAFFHRFSEGRAYGDARMPDWPHRHRTSLAGIASPGLCWSKGGHSRCNSNLTESHKIAIIVCLVMVMSINFRFGTKMGLSPQPSVRSCDLEVALFPIPALGTSFLYCEATLCSNLPLACRLFRVETVFFNFPQKNSLDLTTFYTLLFHSFFKVKFNIHHIVLGEHQEC